MPQPHKNESQKREIAKQEVMREMNDEWQSDRESDQLSSAVLLCSPQLSEQWSQEAKQWHRSAPSTHSNLTAIRGETWHKTQQALTRTLTVVAHLCSSILSAVRYRPSVTNGHRYCTVVLCCVLFTFGVCESAWMRIESSREMSDRSQRSRQRQERGHRVLVTLDTLCYLHISPHHHALVVFAVNEGAHSCVVLYN